MFSLIPNEWVTVREFMQRNKLENASTVLAWIRLLVAEGEIQHEGQLSQVSYDESYLDEIKIRRL